MQTLFKTCIGVICILFSFQTFAQLPGIGDGGGGGYVPTEAPIITALCSEDPAAFRSWEIQNPNDFDLEGTWSTSTTSGDFLIEAGQTLVLDNIPAESDINTPNEVTFTWLDFVTLAPADEVTLISDGSPCTPIEIEDPDPVVPVPVEVCSSMFLSNNSGSDLAKIYSVQLIDGIAQTDFYVELPFAKAHIALNLEGTRLYVIQNGSENQFGYIDLSDKTYHKVANFGLNSVTQMAFDADGHLYFTENTQDKVYRVADVENPVLEDLGKVYLEGKKVDITGADIAFTQEGVFVMATRSKGGAIYRLAAIEDVSGNVEGFEAHRFSKEVNKKTTGLAIMDNGMGNLLFSNDGEKAFHEINIVTGEEVTSYQITGDFLNDYGSLKFGDMSTSCMDPRIELDYCSTIFLADHDSNVNSKVYAVIPDMDEETADFHFLAELPFTDAHIAVNLDASRLYAISGKGKNEIGFVDLATLEYTKIGEVNKGSVYQVAFSPNGHLYFSSASKNEIFVIKDINHPEEIDSYGKISLGDDFMDLAGADIVFNQDGQFIISTRAKDGNIYRVEGGKGNLTATQLSKATKKQTTGMALLDNGTGHIVYSDRNKDYLSVVSQEDGDLITKLAIGGDFQSYLSGTKSKLGWGDMSTSCMTLIEEDDNEPVGGCYAVEVVAYTPGQTTKGKSINSDRMDPNKALGVPEGGDAKNSFVSLGIGGEIILKFGGAIINGEGDDLQLLETTYGNKTCEQYPEKAEVYASQDGVNWVVLGNTCLDGNFDLGNLDWAQYVKIIDTTNPEDFGNADGYDVDGITCIHGTLDEIPGDDEEDLPPLTCENVEIFEVDGNIYLKNTYHEELAIPFTLTDENGNETEGVVVVDAESEVIFDGEVPEGGQVTFHKGAESVLSALTGDYCAIKTGTEVVDAGTRIEKIQVFEEKTYDARSWDWFAPEERQVLKDLEGNTVQDTDKGVSLEDLTTGTNEKDLKVDIQTGHIGYTHVVGIYEIENELPVRPRIILDEIRGNSEASTYIPGTLEKGTEFGLFMVAKGASQNVLVQNKGAQLRFQGEKLQYSTDATTWNDVPTNQVVYTHTHLNKNDYEQAIAGTVEAEDGNTYLRVGFEDITGGGDNDYEDAYFTIYLSGVSHLQCKEVKVTKEVDVFSRMTCGDCQVSFEGSDAYKPEPVTCEVLEITQDEVTGEITLTNNSEYAITVTYDASYQNLDGNASTTIAAIPGEEEWVFKTAFQGVIIQDDKCMIEVSTGVFAATPCETCDQVVKGLGTNNEDEEDEDDITIDCEKPHNVAIEVASVEAVKVGDIVTYDVVVLNNGNEDARGAVLTVLAPENTQILTPGAINGELELPLGDVPVGQSITTQVQLEVVELPNNFAATPMMPSMIAGLGDGADVGTGITSFETSFSVVCTCGVDSDISDNTQLVQTEVVPSLADNARIYPNPIDDKLFIEFDEVTYADITVTLYDSFSRVVYEQTGVLDGGFMVEVNMGDQEAGMYYLKLQSGPISETVRLIKQ